MRERPKGSTALTAALIQTKLTPPPPRTDLVPRPRLVTSLRAGVATSRLTLVSAPAGYGKTTVASEWLAASECRVAWVSLDDDDNDAATFLAYVLAAVTRTCADAFPGGLGTSTLPPNASAAIALAPLINAFSASGDPLALVLDDYHVIRSLRVHGLVSYLLTHAPVRLRLVLLTREDPPLPLPRLRAGGRVAEIRATDLRFDPGEVRRYCQEAANLALSDSSVEILAGRTEGWVAGLQLAGLSVRNRADADAFVERFGGSDRYVFDYLADEVLSRQPPRIRRFLEQTSILSALTAPLCDAVTGRGDGAETLAGLEQANLFLVALDDHRDWYRYHGLFRDVLRSGVPANEAQALHRRAACWLGSHGFTSDAIRHSLAGGEIERAATLVEGAVDEAIERGEHLTLGRWLDALPPAVVADHLHLMVARAWVLFDTGEYRAAEAAIEAIELAAGGRELDPPAAARLTVERAWLAVRRNRADAVALFEQGMATIPTSDAFFRALALMLYDEVVIHHDARQAIRAFAESSALAKRLGSSGALLSTIWTIGSAYVTTGQRRRAVELCRRALADTAEPAGGWPPIAGLALVPLGMAEYEADEIDAAAAHLALGRELCQQAGLGAIGLGAIDTADIRLAHLIGRRDHAWRMLERVRDSAERAGVGLVAYGMHVLAADLRLREGDVAEAERLMAQVFRWTDRPLPTDIAVALATGRHDQALAMAIELELREREAGRVSKLIRVLVLEALALDAGRRRGEAVTVLSEAVRLAAPDDYRRAFLDAGEPAARLLRETHAAAPGFVDDLLARFTSAVETGDGSSTARAFAVRPTRPQGDGGALVEPVSARELAVLRLAARGMTNPEIAQALSIGTGTAKWHVHNLIGKLGVRRRGELFARARELGLL